MLHPCSLRRWELLSLLFLRYRPRCVPWRDALHVLSASAVPTCEGNKALHAFPDGRNIHQWRSHHQTARCLPNSSSWTPVAWHAYESAVLRAGLHPPELLSQSFHFAVWEVNAELFLKLWCRELVILLLAKLWCRELVILLHFSINFFPNSKVQSLLFWMWSLMNDGNTTLRTHIMY